MTQVCLNITNAAFLYTDLEISTYLPVFKFKTLDGNSKFWTS